LLAAATFRQEAGAVGPDCYNLQEAIAILPPPAKALIYYEKAKLLKRSRRKVDHV
jgi:hypothetical protein